MIILLSLALVANILYGGLLFSYFLQWKNVKITDANLINKVSEWPSVSIVIPFRNEAVNLETLFNCLTALDYPSNKLEVILINDHSEDDSLKIIENFNANFRIYSLVNDSGKKAALEFAIRKAIGEWIVTLDADIKFNSNLLKELMFPSIESDIKMICGLVNIKAEKNSAWQNFQSMEFAMLQACGGAALMQNKALLNSGANLAFKKDAWLAVGAYKSHAYLASGDDTFLLFEMNKMFPGKVVSAPNAIVATIAENNFKDLLQQRLRWSGKTIHYKESYVILVGLILITSSFLFLLSIVFVLFFSFKLSPILLAIFTIRAFAESLIIAKYSKHHHLKFSLRNKLMMSIFYPIFLLLILLLQPFNKINWKGREL